MKIFKIVIFFILIFCTNLETKSLEIKNLASINNQTITNLDLIKEVKIREILNNTKINKKNHDIVLQQMINEKIKLIEAENNKIKAPIDIIDQQYNLIKKNKLKEKKITQDLKKVLITKIKGTYKWNKLINFKYKNKLAINIDEINEIMKSKKIPESKKDELLKIEKNKKLNTFSKTHFNKIKKKYLVKKYQ